MTDKRSLISLLKSFTRVRRDTSTRVQIHAETHTNSTLGLSTTLGLYTGSGKGNPII